MVDPAHGALDESYTPEDDSQEVHSVFSEEGTARRQDNGVSDITWLTLDFKSPSKAQVLPYFTDFFLITVVLLFFFWRLFNQMKKPISRTVLPSESMSIDGGLSVPGMSGYSATLDRPYRQPGAVDYPTVTMPRNYHYGPVGGYDDYRGGPPSDYTSLSRGSHMDERYRYRGSFKCFLW